MTRLQDIYPDDRVSLREVGLRDGLQLVKTFPSTAAKQRWVRDEYGAGVRHFEVGSFLPARTFPQFADVREVVRTVAALPGAHGIALALNERGVNEALASGVAEIASVVSATEEHSQANANRSREQAIANVKRLCKLRDASPHRPIVNADGEAFRVPALPIEWNGGSIGEGLKVPVLGADTSALRSELEAQEFSPTGM